MHGNGRADLKGLSLEQCVARDLTKHLSQILKIKNDKLDLDTNLADFGLDSLSLGEFSKVLTEDYGINIVPTTFFNYGTIRKLSRYLAEEYEQKLEQFYKLGDYQVETSKKTVIEPTLAKEINPLPRRKSRSRLKTNFICKEEEPIAVIGMSGRFPAAENVTEFWQNLSKGQRALSEIPQNRWHWKQYYTAPGDPTNQIATNRGGFYPGNRRI